MQEPSHHQKYLINLIQNINEKMRNFRPLDKNKETYIPVIDKELFELDVKKNELKNLISSGYCQSKSVKLTQGGSKAVVSKNVITLTEKGMEHVVAPPSDKVEIIDEKGAL